MKGTATSTASFRQKAVREFKEMAALALYLYICLGRGRVEIFATRRGSDSWDCGRRGLLYLLALQGAMLPE
jgi:hypothetical protein